MQKYMVSLNVISGEQERAANASELMARIMVGLALDDVTVSLNVSQIEIEDDDDDEEESTNG